MRNPEPIFVPFVPARPHDSAWLLTIYECANGAIEMDEAQLSGWDIHEDGRQIPRSVCDRGARERPAGHTVLRQVVRRFDGPAGTWLPTPWQCLQPYVAEGREIGRRIRLQMPLELKDVRDRLTLRAWAPDARQRFHAIKATLQAGVDRE